MHNMAHKSNGYIYTDDAVPSLIRNGALTFYNRLEHHVEQAATLVMHGCKKHERVFTESEVRALLRDIMNDQTSADIANGYVNVVIGWAEIFRKHGVSFLDPA